MREYPDNDGSQFFYFSTCMDKQRNQEATLYVGNLDERVTEALLWELFAQVGVVEKVKLPRDKITGKAKWTSFI